MFLCVFVLCNSVVFTKYLCSWYVCLGWLPNCAEFMCVCVWVWVCVRVHVCGHTCMCVSQPAPNGWCAFTYWHIVNHARVGPVCVLTESTYCDLWFDQFKARCVQVPCVSHHWARKGFIFPQHGNACSLRTLWGFMRWLAKTLDILVMREGPETEDLHWGLSSQYV